MNRPIQLLALAAMLGVACPSAVSQTPGSAASSVLPAPQIILTVPIKLSNIPPEVDQYQVDCLVFLSDAKGKRHTAKGSASGALPAVVERAPGRNFSGEATVPLAIPNATAELLPLPVRPIYECKLHLQGSSFGLTTIYMGDKAIDKAFPYGDGQSAFPLADGAPFQRIVHESPK
jgi:hypothetical protein